MTQSSKPDHRPFVVHLVPQDGLGGVESAARSAAASVPDDCRFRLEFMAGKTLADDRRHIREHPDRRLNDPFTYMSAARDLLKEKPDVLVTSLWRAMLVGLAVKSVRPSTFWVCLLHSSNPVHFLDRVVQRWSIRKADVVWADSATTARAAKAEGRSALCLSFVRNAMAEPRDPPPVASFVNWSRLDPIKGHDRAFHLIHRLRTSGLNASLDLWGPDAGEGSALAALVTDLGLGEVVSFRGNLAPDKLADAASGHAFYLGLSRQEGMAMAVVEAMQLGLIPVVTAVGEPARYVRDGENGLIVDPANLDEAARRIAALLDAPDRMKAMAKAAAATWADAPTYADDFFAAVRDLLKRRRPHATQ